MKYSDKDFLTANEVSELIGKSKPHCYKIIHALNEELQEKGLLTFPGRVPTEYFCKRTGLRWQH